MMKQAFHDVGLLEHDGVVYGINLGWDFTGEHEFGLRGIKKALRFEVKDPADFRTELPEKWQRTDAGIGKRLMTQTREGVESQTRLKDYGKATKTLPAETRMALVSRGIDGILENSMKRKNLRFPSMPMALPQSMKDRTPQPLATSWTDNAFIIRAFADRERAFLKELHEAMLAGDLAIGLSGQEAFGRSGLTLVIPSRMPEAVGDLVLEQDVAENELQAAAEATGIHQKIKDAGLGYYALSPKWTNFFKGESAMTSDYPVVFFLNPHEQRKFNSGWMTVEDLIAWTEGLGPVVEEKPAAAMAP